MGKGLALRWCPKHEIILGSRDLTKAVTVARNYNSIARGFYGDEIGERIQGNLNTQIIKTSNVIVVALPPQHTIEIMHQTRNQLTLEQVVISTIVPMTREGKLFKYLPFPSDGPTSLSAAERIAKEIEPVTVISAFQTVPASYLADLDSTLNIDVLISGDNEHALELASELVRDIPNLRPLRVGPLANSRLVESITPLLLNAAILNRLKDPSIRIVPWVPSDFEK
jgi:hypothetical protein